MSDNTRPRTTEKPGDPRSGPLARRRDLFAGGLLILIGLPVAIKGMSYNLGTLMRMGPGLMPTALGALLAIIGLAVCVGALIGGGHEGEGFLPGTREWRAWALIVIAPFVFILAGTFLGLAPAIFATVFVASFADRTTTIKDALLLSATVTVVGIVIFSYVLSIPMPIVSWRTS